MARKLNLSRMDFEALIGLREQVEGALSMHRAALEKQLERFGGSITSMAASKRRGSRLKGKTVPAKYRGPDGETWAGRGATPRWLVAAVKEGRKIEDFLINKTAAATREVKRKIKRRAKR
jgi:DNA-binding protein H-NS